MSINMVWPIILIVFSNVFYNIFAKSQPVNLNPFASLTVVYVVAAIVSGIFYFVQNPGQSLIGEYKNLNWTSIVLGIAIVGLEVGSLYMYKVGWNINTGYLVHSSILSICLLFVGFFLYGEAISLTKILGAIVCVIGLILINK